MGHERKILSACVAALFGLSACTDPGETTGIGAATGGALGAGLGAIVGSQTGDAGSGLVLGGIAGASTGALVGNAFESQEQAIRRQDERLQRQDRTITAQQAEITELRRLSQDSVSFRGQRNDRPGSSSGLSGVPLAYQPPRRDGLAPSGARPGIGSSGTTGGFSSGVTSPVAALRERDIVPPFIPARPSTGAPLGVPSNAMAAGDMSANADAARAYAVDRRPQLPDSARAMIPSDPVRLGTGQSGTAQSDAVSLDSAPSDPVQANAAQPSFISGAGSGMVGGSVAALSTSDGPLSECQQAAAEVERAQAARDAADKLFHYRRALRLCPNNARYHSGLGEVYLSLNRRTDAEFEFKEALVLDPDESAARRNLTAMNRKY